MARYNCYYVDKDDDNLVILIERIDSSCDGVTSSYYEFSVRHEVTQHNRKVNTINIKAIKNPVDYMYHHFSSKSLEESKLDDEACKKVVEMAKVKSQTYKSMENKHVVVMSPLVNAKNVKVYPAFVKLFMNEKNPVIEEDDRYNNSKALLKSFRINKNNGPKRVR